MRRSNAEIEEIKRTYLERKMDSISDEDISIANAWDHSQNIESSEKLLHRLEFYHGGKENIDAR
jgi:hypothetical protein